MLEITEFTYFFPEKPVLISKDQPLFNTLSAHKDWIAERKYNGTRLQLHKIGNEFHFYGRHYDKLSYVPTPEMLAALNALNLPSGYCLFDGELRHNKTVGVKHKIMLYDIYVWDNELQSHLKFKERRQNLLNVVQFDAEPIGCPYEYPDSFENVYDAVINDDEIEGLVMKNGNGMLNLGRRTGAKSKWMFKVRKPSGRYKF